MWCDAQRRVVERCDAPKRVALPTVMSISPTRLIDYAKTWCGREATARQCCCRIVFLVNGVFLDPGGEQRQQRGDKSLPWAAALVGQHCRVDPSRGLQWVRGPMRR